MESDSPDLDLPPSLTPLDEALALLTADLQPVEPEEVAIRDAEGLVLAAPVTAPEAVPQRTIALRAGWAVRSEDLAGASSYSPVLLPGSPVRVEAGQVLPAGTDAVLPLGAVSPEAGFAEITASAAPGEGSRRTGEDAASGAPLRGEGDRMRALDIAVAAGCGVAPCAVRRARVRVAAPPGSASGDLASRLSGQAGARVERISSAGISPGGVAAFAGETCDLLVLVVGPEQEACVQEWAQSDAVVRGLALRPGEDAGCGIVDGVRIVLVPERIEAALATILCVVRPCLDRLMAANPPWASHVGPLTRKVASTVGFTEIALLRETKGGLEPLARGDLTLTALARAEAWFAVPPEAEGYPAGAVVQGYAL